MKISINRANKLRNALEALTIPVSCSVPVRTSDGIEMGLLRLVSAEASLLGVIENVDKRHKFVRTLRDLIFNANVKNEIVPIIAEIAAIEATIKSLTNLLSTVTVTGGRYNSIDDFKAKVEYRERLATNPEGAARLGAHETITLDATGPAKEVLTEELRRLKLTLGEKQEERNRKNHENYIELPADLVEFLKVHALIA